MIKILNLPKTLSLKFFISFTMLIALQFNLSSPANAKRLALIIGNDLYANVTPLKKAVNDADAISSTLTDLGFQTHLYSNLNRRSMNAALAEIYQRD